MGKVFRQALVWGQFNMGVLLKSWFFQCGRHRIGAPTSICLPFAAHTGPFVISRALHSAQMRSARLLTNADCNLWVGCFATSCGSHDLSSDSSNKLKQKSIYVLQL